MLLTFVFLGMTALHASRLPLIGAARSIFPDGDAEFWGRWILQTYKISIAVQILLGVASVPGLFVESSGSILWEALLIEDTVQVVEFLYYSIVVCCFRRRQIPTVTRYIDWCLTTPSMLISLICFSAFQVPETRDTTISALFSERADAIVLVVVADLIMLAYGACAEVGSCGIPYGVAGGTVAFAVAFGVILVDFSWQSMVGSCVWAVTAAVWSMYAVAALLPYGPKNVMYNCLDLVSKNAFGAFLSVYLIAKG